MDELLDQIANGCDPEADVPDDPADPGQPDTPDTPAQPDNPGGGSFIGGIIDYWRHH